MIKAFLSRVGLIKNESPRPHEAAGRGRRFASVHAPGSGPNAILSGDLPELIRRSRAAYRNNGWIKQGLQRHVSNTVGAHITPLFKIADEDIRNALRQQWPLFVDKADADGALNFYGQLALADLTRRLAGECFVRIRPRRNDGALPVPLQVQLLEPEMVPLEKTEVAPNGNQIIHGIEFNRRGQRVAYHVYTEHPLDWTGARRTYLRTVRIPTRFMLHHYKPERPGQIRGKPETVQSLVAAFDYAEYSQSELVRKKAKAAHTAVVERDEYPEEEDFLYDPMTGSAIGTPDDGMTTIEPGAYNVLLPGEKVRFADGDNTGSGYSDFQRWQLLSMSAGMTQPYPIFTGDMTGINDRLWRAITNEYYRALDMDRDHLVVHQICDPVKNWFVDTCWLLGLVDMPDYQQRRSEYQAVTWQPHGRKYLHPVQDVQARVMEINAGLQSRSASVADLGRNAEDIDKQQEADDARRTYPTDSSTANTNPDDEGT